MSMYSPMYMASKIFLKTWLGPGTHTCIRQVMDKMEVAVRQSGAAARDPVLVRGVAIAVVDVLLRVQHGRHALDGPGQCVKTCGRLVAWPSVEQRVLRHTGILIL